MSKKKEPEKIDLSWMRDHKVQLFMVFLAGIVVGFIL